MVHGCIKAPFLKHSWCLSRITLTAFKCKSIKVLFFYLSFSRDVDPVVFAIRRGDVEAVNDLAASAPHSLLKENKDGWIPLHDAAYCGQAECLRTLLRGMTLRASLMVPNSAFIHRFLLCRKRKQIYSKSFAALFAHFPNAK